MIDGSGPSPRGWEPGSGKRAVDELNFKIGVSHPIGARLQASMTRVFRTAVIRPMM
jgi:hypothetical protein